MEEHVVVAARHPRRAAGSNRRRPPPEVPPMEEPARAPKEEGGGGHRCSSWPGPSAADLVLAGSGRPRLPRPGRMRREEVDAAANLALAEGGRRCPPPTGAARGASDRAPHLSEPPHRPLDGGGARTPVERWGRRPHAPPAEGAAPLRAPRRGEEGGRGLTRSRLGRKKEREGREAWGAAAQGDAVGRGLYRLVGRGC